MSHTDACRSPQGIRMSEPEAVVLTKSMLERVSHDMNKAATLRGAGWLPASTCGGGRATC
eukprot:6191817-Pleurochrysis_carterae.AAC.5